jgi:hypothetical protein
LLFVNLEARVNTPDRGVCIGIRWEAIKFEAIAFVSDAAVHRLKLVALEWAIRIDTPVEEIYDDALFLDATNRELIMREWRNQCRILRQLL